MELLERIDHPVAEGRVHYVDSRVRAALGQGEEARCSLERARDAFDRAGARSWQQKAEAALLDLAAEARRLRSEASAPRLERPPRSMLGADPILSPFCLSDRPRA